MPRKLPILVASCIAIVELLTFGGLFFPDSAQFVRSTLHFSRDAGGLNVIPPAYPLLLDGILLAVPVQYRMLFLVVLQQASTVAVCWFVQRTLELRGSPRLGWVAGLLTALYVPLGLFAQTANTETLFVFYVMASVLLFTAAVTRRESPLGRRGLLFFAAAGAVAGVAMAQRTVGIAVPAAAAAALLLGRARPRLLPLAVYGAGFAAVVGLFCLKNSRQHGTWALVEGTGVHLFGRIAQVEKRGPDTPEFRELVAVSEEAGETLFQPNGGWTLLLRLNEHRGMSLREADALLGRVAADALLADPVRSLRLTVSMMSRMVQPVDTFEEHFTGGMRPASYESFERWAVGCWSEYPEKFLELEVEFPGYSPPASLGAVVIDVFALWSRVTQRVVKGTWTLVLLLVLALVSVWRRQAALMHVSLLPLGLLAAATGDQPFPRYWEVAMPACFLCVLMHVPAFLGGAVRARAAPKRHRLLRYAVAGATVVVLGEAALHVGAVTVWVGQRNEPLPPPRARTVLCVGDGFPAGAGVGREHAFPALLPALLDASSQGSAWRVVNCAVAGQRSHDVHASLERQLRTTRARYALIAGGLHDCGREPASLPSATLVGAGLLRPLLTGGDPVEATADELPIGSGFVPPSPDVRAITMGVAALAARRLERAAELGRAALVSHPGDPRSYSLTALACMRAGRVDEARGVVASCRARVRAEPERFLAEAWVRLARLVGPSAGRPEVEELARRIPTSDLLWARVAGLRYAESDAEGARAAVRQAIASATTARSRSAHYRLLAQLQVRERPQEAVASWLESMRGQDEEALFRDFLVCHRAVQRPALMAMLTAAGAPPEHAEVLLTAFDRVRSEVAAAAFGLGQERRHALVGCYLLGDASMLLFADGRARVGKVAGRWVARGDQLELTAGPKQLELTWRFVDGELVLTDSGGGEQRWQVADVPTPAWLTALEQRLEAMVDTCVRAGVVPVFVTYPFESFGVSEVMRRLAKRRGTELVDATEIGVESPRRGLLLDDRTTPRWHERVAEQVAPVLARLQELAEK